MLSSIIDYWLTKGAEFYNRFIENLLNKDETEMHCPGNEDKSFLQRDL